MVKYCACCKLELDDSQFNWKVKNIKRASYCRVCSRKYVKEHYQKNKKYYVDKAKKRNIEFKKKEIEFLGKYLQSHHCIDCGENDILVLEFDHKNRADKTEDISIMLRRRLAFKTLVEEIAKCEVRCANCHRRKTEKENNSWKLKYAPVA